MNFVSDAIFQGEFFRKVRFRKCRLTAFQHAALQAAGVRDFLTYVNIRKDGFRVGNVVVHNGVRRYNIVMGSMFRLSYKIKMKERKEEKASASGEPGAKNGNLEIAVLPFVEAQNHL